MQLEGEEGRSLEERGRLFFSGEERPCADAELGITRSIATFFCESIGFNQQCRLPKKGGVQSSKRQKGSEVRHLLEVRQIAVEATGELISS